MRKVELELKQEPDEQPDQKILSECNVVEGLAKREPPAKAKAVSEYDKALKLIDTDDILVDCPMSSVV